MSKQDPTLLDRFAEAISEHDLESGDPGGDTRKAAAALGISEAYGRALLKRIRDRQDAPKDRCAPGSGCRRCR